VFRKKLWTEIKRAFVQQKT